ncbi:citrate/2-methylcitrate synthase [Sphaerobacter thermophilus]|uniref:Citrate synthase n=1 Tax=Sphaerobacter thermophilus (strain ATCC 49802 / DSM 20745 / KCCM 41009 / NCIMB 13125 / S 6022) TaxID=479434 RepID=D1CAN7_SPHTD|nr:citrate/2-methylcitrate synthase [Sphaerobacter thermophilus]ACZ40880.1 2-methylcitrate synthase/citrate synthase II [Sphaerobacter thermophilus DSM 20745]PZN59367.1 MAG: citrate synthase [Sphaerobacter thermophilus]
MTARGLEGVVAGTTQLSSIIDGVLTYRGINIDDLAEHASYEEVVHLLFFGRLPTRAELDDLRRQLSALRPLPEGLMTLLRTVPRDAVPMDTLRTAVSALGFYEEHPNDTSREVSVEKALRLVAQVPTIVAALERLRRGQEPVPPPEGTDTAHAFLLMLKGTAPDEVEVDAMNKILVLHADHEFNASTFAARVTAATLADMHAAVTAAVAALKGPLHGGANAAVMAALQEIGDLDGVEPYVLEKLARKERIMGFGHRVYKQGDPRAKWLREMSRRLAERSGEPKWYEMSVRMDEVMQREKGLFPNVDFYAATVYHYLGIPKDLMTPVFATSRISGWTAHILEQYGDNRLIRPRADYTGPTSQAWVPIDQRG